MRFQNGLIGVIGILITTQIVTNASSQTHTRKSSEPNFLVIDYDFVNTNTKKVCMLATVNASVHLRNKLTGNPFTIQIPSDSSTEGSYCNIDFKSLLALKFGNNVVKITFTRDHEEIPRRSGVHDYCTYCNYGQWTIQEMAFTIRHNETDFHATTVAQTMRTSFPPVLAGGITLRRSFRCHTSDATMKIPLTVSRVTNVTDGQHTNVKGWTAEIDFTTMQFQPFLVPIPSKGHKETFSDPVLCRDVTASHVIVILLPLIYFAILIACYYIKTKYGCPVWKKNIESAKTDEDRRKFITSECSADVTHHNETYHA